MTVDHDRARVLQGRADRLNKLLSNPPDIECVVEMACLETDDVHRAELAAVAVWVEDVAEAHREQVDGQ